MHVEEEEEEEDMVVQEEDMVVQEEDMVVQEVMVVVTLSALDMDILLEETMDIVLLLLVTPESEAIMVIVTIQ